MRREAFYFRYYWYNYWYWQMDLLGLDQTQGAAVPLKVVGLKSYGYKHGCCLFLQVCGMLGPYRTALWSNMHAHRDIHTPTQSRLIGP